jgi:phosphodiesterase/alkaline phosphatase D-like protein
MRALSQHWGGITRDHRRTQVTDEIERRDFIQGVGLVAGAAAAASTLAAGLSSDVHTVEVYRQTEGAQGGDGSESTFVWM